MRNFREKVSKYYLQVGAILKSLRQLLIVQHLLLL